MIAKQKLAQKRLTLLQLSLDGLDSKGFYYSIEVCVSRANTVGCLEKLEFLFEY